MKFAIKRLNLVNALTVANKAIQVNNPRKILQGIKFEINEFDGLTLTSCNNDLSILTKVRLRENNEEIITDVIRGDFVCENKIVEIVKQMSNDTVTLELVEDTLLEVYDGISRYKLNCLKAVDYPEIDFTLDEEPLVMKSSTFKGVIDQTAFAISEKDTRPALNGVNFRCRGNRLDAVATDALRLAKKTIILDKSFNFNVTIPAKTLLEVAKISENEGNELTIKVNERRVLFTLNNTIVNARVIAGLFPETDRLIPDNFKYRFEVSSENILDALKRSILVESQYVKLGITQYQASLSSRSQDAGSFDGRIENFNFDGESFEIAFRSRFVKEAVQSLNDTTVVFRFNSDTEPFVITSPKDKSVIELIIPVRNF